MHLMFLSSSSLVCLRSSNPSGLQCAPPFCLGDETAGLSSSVAADSDKAAASGQQGFAIASAALQVLPLSACRRTVPGVQKYLWRHIGSSAYVSARLVPSTQMYLRSLTGQADHHEATSVPGTRCSADLLHCVWYVTIHVCTPNSTSAASPTSNSINITQACICSSRGDFSRAAPSRPTRTFASASQRRCWLYKASHS